MDLSDLRIDYLAEGFDHEALADDPFVQFERWFGEATASDDPEPYAMVLSTVDIDGWPRGRNVLLRGVDHGFVFYTNRESDKGRALDHTRRAALTFRWFDLHRQVHVDGAVERVSDEQSDAYFAKRPRKSQLGAWASEQSQPLADRAQLLAQMQAAEERFEGIDVPRPPYWSGYRVVPRRVEFWQGVSNRLHDRVRYDWDEGWLRVVLNP